MQVSAPTIFSTSPAQGIISTLVSKGGMMIGIDEAHKVFMKTRHLIKWEQLSDTTARKAAMGTWHLTTPGRNPLLRAATSPEPAPPQHPPHYAPHAMNHQARASKDLLLQALKDEDALHEDALQEVALVPSSASPSLMTCGCMGNIRVQTRITQEEMATKRRPAGVAPRNQPKHIWSKQPDSSLPCSALSHSDPLSLGLSPVCSMWWL